MLSKLAALRAQRRIAKPIELPAPLKGWNTRDPFEAMDPLDAILIDNWYPDFQGLVTRNGFASFASGLGAGPVQTLAWFNSGSTSKLLGACSGAIYDITAGGAPGAALASGFSADAWQTVLFNNHLFWANGRDSVQIFDGTAVSTATFTGVTLSTLAGVISAHNRLCFWTGTDAGFWYGPVNGITGPLTFFDLSSVSASGGNLVTMDRLSYDGGSGIQDYTCFFMSSGEMLMYSGTDPSNAGNWALVGSYPIAPPVAKRSLARYGGDIYITTANDHQQLSRLLLALRLGETPPRSKATGAVKEAYIAGSSLAGWQALYYPGGTRILYNVPNQDGTFCQHVYNTATQAWCRFQNMNAWCWSLFGQGLYFGGANGTVYKADTGNTDAGNAIQAQAQQAWNTLQSPLKKRVIAVRPVTQSTTAAAVQLSLSLAFDYRPAVIASGIGLDQTALPTLIWDVNDWDAPQNWAGAAVTDPRWNITGGEGAAIGIGLNASVNQGPLYWMRTDLMLEPGSGL